MPETSPIDEIRAAFESVVIRSPGELMISGESCRVPDPIALFQMNAAAFATSPMLGLLQAQIYSRLYSRASGAATSGEDITPILSAANRGVDHWEEGWVVVGGMAGGMLTVTRDDVTTNLLPAQYVVPPGGAVPAGTSLTALIAREAPQWQDGFYYVLSETPIDIRHESRMTRVYFHITEEGAPALVSAVSELLNAFQIPFRFKVLNRRGLFNRADSAVIFAPKRWFRTIAELLPRIAARTKDFLGDATPLMSRRVAPGIGVAEDPATAGDSFGTHRARLLSLAVWNCYTRGTQLADARIEALEELFRTNGLRLDRPYLNAGSADLYDVPAFEV
jgi:hypothetical protein